MHEKIKQGLVRKYRDIGRIYQISKIFDMTTDQPYELFLDDLITQLGTLFSGPEEKLVTQGEKSNAMYFVVSGNSIVTQKYHHKNDNV